MATVEVHKGCGGIIQNRVCSKCHKQWGKLKYYMAGDIESQPVKFNPDKYRERIRKGKDIL